MTINFILRESLGEIIPRKKLSDRRAARSARVLIRKDRTIVCCARVARL